MYNPSRQQIIERWNDMPDILKDAMHSSLVIDDLDSTEQKFHLDEDKGTGLARLVRGVFYGFIHFENIYNEIRDTLRIDPRLALDIYHELDKKVFDPFRKEIEDNYIKHKVGAIKESEVAQPSIPSQVVLREGSETINLKPEISAEFQPMKLKIETVPIAEKSGGPAPVSLGGISAATEISKTQTVAPQSKPVAPGDQVIPEAPFMLHKKEESQSVAQAQAASAYKQTSFGGFFGSLKAAGMPKSQEPVSTARIEMPFDQKPLEPGAQKVPVVVKRYETEPVKTVHYSDLKTTLERKEDGSIKPVMPLKPALVQPKKPETGGGMIDLTNLTLKK